MEQLETIKRKLTDRRIYVVAEATGLSYQGIRNIIMGKTKNPSIQTVQKLQEYLNATA
jgi:transcriptional regulator with XRE-family HTH domain